MLSNCGAGEDSWESLGQKGDQTSQLNQHWIFTGKTDAEAEAPILWPPDVMIWLMEKTLMLEKTEGRREGGDWRMRWLDGIINSVHMSLSKLWQIVRNRRAWCAAAQGVTKSGHDWATEHNRSYWCVFKIFFSFNLAWTHGFLVVVRVRILSMPPPIPHTCEKAFMWLKHLCRYDHSYKSGDEPHLITQPLKSRKPFRMRFRKMQHRRTLPAIAGFEDGGRRLQAKGIGCL